jgi:hypothetical protein
VFGILLANWFWQLGPDAAAFLGDDGMLPRSAALTHFPDRFSLLHLVGETWLIHLFLVIATAVALLLAVGYRTRTMAILAFVAVISVQNRDPLILDGSDLVFRMSAFWLIFTAAGDMWSIDAAVRRARGEATRRTGLALPVRILQLQAAWIYLATGLEKLLGQGWLTGTATWYALQLKHTFGRAHAEPLLAIPGFVRLTTVGTMLVELFFLPMVFFPVLQPWVRLLAVVAAAGLHVGIIALMNVGNFPIVMLALLLLFLPARWIERAVAAVPASRAASRFADRVVAHGIQRAPHLFAPARHEPLVRRPPAALPYVASAALVALAAATFASATPKVLGEAPREPQLVASLRYAGLEQRWDMFSPEPASADGWISARGVLADGTRVELIGDDGRPIPQRPLVVRADGPIEPRYADPLFSRWVKVYERIPRQDHEAFRLEFGRMFCRMRNLDLPAGASPLVSFDVTYVERLLQPPGSGPPVLRTHEVWSHAC